MAEDQTPDVPPIEPKPAAAKPRTANPATPSSVPPIPPVPPAERPNPYVQSSPPAPVAPQPYAHGPYVAAPPQGLSITSMILGIIGVAISCCYGLGFLLSLGAVITGHLATKREPHARGFWLTGVITGYVGLGVAVVVWLIALASIVIPWLIGTSYGY